MKPRVRTNLRFGKVAATLIGLGTLLSILVTPVVEASSHQAAAKPRYGGSVAYWNGQTPDCVDPQKTALGSSFGIFSKVVDTLLSINQKGKFTDNLATSWKFSNKGLTLTLNLRKGVKFSNGDPFNAKAVKFTFDRALNPATKSPVTAGNLTDIGKTTVVNNYTVRLSLKAPSRVLLTNLASTYTGIMDPKSTKKQGNNTCTQLIGTGPYKIQSVTPDKTVFTLARNTYRNWAPSWYHNHGKPYLDQIVAKAFTSNATAISELLAKQLDVATVPGDQLSRVQGASGLYLKTLPAQDELFFGFNMSKPPFDNVDVRKAFGEAIDRSAILKAAYNNLGKVVYGPLPPSIPDYDKKSPTYGIKYNPTDAQKILSANHVTGPFDLLAYSSTANQNAAELIQAELAQVGVKINIVIKPIGDFVTQAGKGGFDVDLLDWGYDDPDVLYVLFHSSQCCGKGINFSFMPSSLSSQLDALLVKGRQDTNPKKAAAAYAQAQKLITTQAIIIPLLTEEGPTAFRNRVQGIHYDISGGLVWQDMFVTK